MNASFFFTVQNPGEGLFKEKGSKFIAFVYPVSTEEDIKQTLTALKKEYYDASHHCYAWVLGANKERYRAFDDGEPNHSAGDPILGQIRSRNLTNILIVVVRYFGGTKLGVSGLINAYRAAADDALNKVVIVETVVTNTVVLTFDYPQTPEVMRLVKEFNLTILKQTFNEQCRMEATVGVVTYPQLVDRLAYLNATGHPIVLT